MSCGNLKPDNEINVHVLKQRLSVSWMTKPAEQLADASSRNLCLVHSAFSLKDLMPKCYNAAIVLSCQFLVIE